MPQNPSSGIGKLAEIPGNPHGDWLVVTRRSRGKPRADTKEKGKDSVKDSRGSNRFSNLELN